jgi:hypothetical protein
VRRRAAIAVALAAAAAAAWPVGAAGHGLVGRADLPIPSWLFGWAASVVLVVSFVALATLWPEPRLEGASERRLFRVPAWVDPLCGAVGIALFLLVVYAGLRGTTESAQNLAPNFVYVHFWVGLVIASVLFGDVIVAFAWLELVYPEKADPRILGALCVAFFAAQLAAIAVFGVERWTERGDGFSVYFNLFARLSPLVRRDGVLRLRPPLSGAPGLPVMAGSVALLCVAIGTTTFDGFSNGPVWASLNPDLQSVFKDLGLGSTRAVELAGTVGLLGCVAAVSGIYWLGVRGMTTVGRGHSTRELAARFAHTLIPIAFAYAVAHYFSLLVFQGQSIAYLISDPLGDGSDVFGTAHSRIDYGAVSSRAIWYVQVGALVVGHVSGLILAHDRALTVYKRVRDATRSQYWMLVVMVGFTSLGLWLLSAVRQ